MSNFKIGQKVVVTEKAPWHSNQIYTIIDFDPFNNQIAIIDPDLPKYNKDPRGNRIHIGYLILASSEQITLERKEKLKKICQTLK